MTGEGKFIANVAGIKVLTPTGYQPFSGLRSRGSRTVISLKLENGTLLNVTPGHVFVGENGEVCAADVGAGPILTEQGWMRVVESYVPPVTMPVYDLTDVGDNSLYYTSGALSHNCRFVSSDETLISSVILSSKTGTMPMAKIDENIRVWSEPEPNVPYLVGLDPSMGTGGDYAAIQVFRMDTMEQVAEWMHNLTDTPGQVRKLLMILNFLDQSLRSNREQMGEPEIFWTLEVNGLGEAPLQIIKHYDEDRFPGTFVSERLRPGQVRTRKGLTTTRNRKIAACNRLKTLFESGRLTIHSEPLLNELKNFVAGDGSYRAKTGYHDDLISATLLVVRMLDLVSNRVMISTDHLKASATIDDDDDPMRGVPAIVI